MGPDYKMQDMDEKENVLSSLLDSVEEYGKTSFELFKLKRLDKASDIAATVISRIAAIIAYMTFLLMASIGAAFWLGSSNGQNLVWLFCRSCILWSVGINSVFLYAQGTEKDLCRHDHKSNT